MKHLRSQTVWSILAKTNMTMEKQPFEDVSVSPLNMVILHCHVSLGWCNVPWMVYPTCKSPQKLPCGE